MGHCLFLKLTCNIGDPPSRAPIFSSKLEQNYSIKTTCPFWTLPHIVWIQCQWLQILTPSLGEMQMYLLWLTISKLSIKLKPYLEVTPIVLSLSLACNSSSKPPQAITGPSSKQERLKIQVNRTNMKLYLKIELQS